MAVTAVVHQRFTKANPDGYCSEDAVAVATLFEGEPRLDADEHVDESYGGY